jgi:PTH1 family peptidyl-tRNA hydrolase
MIKQILLGIGNVGDRYNGTRHNIGFDIIESIAQSAENLKPVSFSHSVASEAEINGEKVLLLKPTTLVNLSGLAAREALDRYELSAEDMLVIVDDFHLPLEAIRYRRKGSAGGHNGLKSLIEECGKEFHRLRCGVGPLPENESIIDFVLGHFGNDEIDAKIEAVNAATQTIPTYLKEGIVEAMNRFNSQKKNDKKDSSTEDPGIEEK